MTEQIKAMLDEAAHTQEPPSMINGNDVVAKGRSRNRAKRLQLAGAVTLGVAVAAVTAVVLVPGTGGGLPADHGDGAAAADQPDFPLPDIDMKDGYAYTWAPYLDSNGDAPDGAITQTEESARYGDAFWQYLEDGFDIMETTRPSDDETENLEPLTEDNRVKMTRDLMQVNEVKDGDAVPVDHEPIPWYALQAMISVGDGIVDTIDVAVHPRGSFESGAGPESGYRNLYTCDAREAGPHGRQPAAVERACKVWTGSDGEKIAEVTTRLTVDRNEFVSERRLVVYRADGTAISVTDWDAHSATDADESELEPTFSFDQLTELALALPEYVVVE